jgi:hypothetical protein
MLSHIPNGVACIVHQNKDNIESVIDESEKLKNSKDQLHHDHAQFLLPVQVCDLRNKRRSYLDEIKSKGYSLRRQHIIRKGHHLETMLTLSLEKKLNILDSHFILTMFSLTSGNRWLLDLPGGKRHLGEDTFDCMIRETEEEASVKIEKWWIRKHDVSFDSTCYFVIEPNDNLILNFSLKNQSSDIKNKLGLNSPMVTENENNLDFLCNVAATYN